MYDQFTITASLAVFLILFVLFKFALKKTGQSIFFQNFSCFIFSGALTFLICNLYIAEKAFTAKINSQIISKLPRRYQESLLRLSEVQMSKVSALGIGRLPASDIYQWNKTRLKLSRKNTDFCVGLYNGDIQQKTVAKAFSTLTDNELNSYTDLFAKGILLALESEGPVNAEPKDFYSMIDQIVGAMGPEGKSKYINIAIKKSDAESENMCWFMKSIMRYATQNENDKTERFLRALSAIGYLKNGG